MTKPLVHKIAIMEKFPGKGGWTYVRLPEIIPDKKTPFGWIRVRGNIDNYGIQQYHLMPMGNGELFLPIKSDIRKQIGKQAGDMVEVILFLDNSPIAIPDDFAACLRDEPMAYKHFYRFSETEQNKYIKWILRSAKESVRIERMAQAINAIAKGHQLDQLKKYYK